MCSTMQVRIHQSAGHGTMFWYFENVEPARAAQLAADALAARCVTDVDYLSVHDDAYADTDDPPVLVADWQGRPAITVRDKAPEEVA